MRFLNLPVFGLALVTVGCTSLSLAPEVREAEPMEKDQWVETGHTSKGKASWYSIRCNGGRHTASGQPLSDDANTAAHKTLPMGTWVRVTNLHNGRAEIVRITDRGPYIRGRVIDVTIGVARKLDFVHAGVVPVKVEVVQKAM